MTNRESNKLVRDFEKAIGICPHCHDKSHRSDCQHCGGTGRGDSSSAKEKETSYARPFNPRLETEDYESFKNDPKIIKLQREYDEWERQQHNK